MQRLFFLISLCLCSLIVSAAPQAKIDLPDIGTSTALRSSQDERMRADAIMRRLIRQSLPIIDDPEIDNYIWNFGYRLVANSDFRREFFNFFVVNDTSINAFAGPSGNIGINAGLILTAQNESELAAVVAHEIAHVTQRHLDRTMSAQEKLSLPTAAALVAAIILSSQNINLAEAALAATLAANIQTQINYTRTHEQEADHIGMQILAESRFNPRSMASFFERLQQADRLTDIDVPEFLRTHPVTNSRIADAKDRARAYQDIPQEENLIFYLIKAKLRALTNDNPAELVKRYTAEIDVGRHHMTQPNFAQRYGYSHALLKANKIHRARMEVQWLLKQDRERIPYLTLLAKIELTAGNIAKSLAIYEDALKLSPNNYTLIYYYADTLLHANKAPEAKQKLAIVNGQRVSPSYYELLAKAEGDAGFTGAAHRALAEFYFLYGHTHMAIEQLKMALQQKDISTIDANRIENRIESLKKSSIVERELL